MDLVNLNLLNHHIDYLDYYYYHHYYHRCYYYYQVVLLIKIID
eukprot:UN04311